MLEMSESNSPSNEVSEGLSIKPEVRQAILDQIGDDNLDVIIVHSGGIEEVDIQGEKRYRSTSWAENSKSEIGTSTGGRLRALAGAQVARVLPATPIITTSFSPKEGWPTMAHVLNEELQRRGVDGDRIEEEGKSFSSASQLVEMMRISTERGYKKIGGIINSYHVPRMKAIMDNFESIVENEDWLDVYRKFKESSAEVIFIASKPIVKEISPHLSGYLDAVEQSSQFQENVRLERNGVADIESGKYRIRGPQYVK